MNITIEHRTVSIEKDKEKQRGRIQHEQYEVCTQDECIGIFFSEQKAKEYVAMLTDVERLLGRKRKGTRDE